MAATPAFVLQPGFEPIQPLHGGFLHAVPLHAGRKHLPRLISSQHSLRDRSYMLSPKRIFHYMLFLMTIVIRWVYVAQRILKIIDILIYESHSLVARELPSTELRSVAETVSSPSSETETPAPYRKWTPITPTAPPVLIRW